MRRPALLAGQWYPGSASACRQAIEAHARDAKPEQGPYRGLIGPHAGWSYSGDAAARTYGWLARAQPEVDLVVVFGSHRGPEGPNTVFRGEAWETPLGDLASHQELAERLAAELQLRDEPAQPHHADNGVELHLPFVRYFFPAAKLLMLGPAASRDAITIGATRTSYSDVNYVPSGSALTYTVAAIRNVPKGLDDALSLSAPPTSPTTGPTMISSPRAKARKRWRGRATPTITPSSPPCLPVMPNASSSMVCTSTAPAVPDRPPPPWQR